MILCVLFLKDKQGLKILVKYKLISHTVRERMYSNKKPNSERYLSWCTTC